MRSNEPKHKPEPTGADDIVVKTLEQQGVEMDVRDSRREDRQGLP